MRVVEQKNNHLRVRVCDCCGSVIEYPGGMVRFHSSAEDGFGGDIWMASIDCPNCKSQMVWDVTTKINESGGINMKKHYGLGSLIFDFIMTIVTGGLWLIWIFIRFLRANS